MIIMKNCVLMPGELNLDPKSIVENIKHSTLFHMGGGGKLRGGADSTRLQIVFFITSIRDAAEPRNLVTFPKI